MTNLDSIARQQIEQFMDSKVKPALIKSHQIIVADWDHKPKFQSRKFIRPDKISVTVFPTGPNAEIWKFVDQGTKAHTIRAKNVPFLKFKTGYQPKTLARPARTVSGGGKATGQTVYAKSVKHPGTQAREFTKQIAEDIQPSFREEIENAFKQVAKLTKE